MELLMEVFNNNFERIGTFDKYSSVIYNRTLCTDSNYTLTLPFERDTIDLLMDGTYLLIDRTFLAEMRYIQKESGETTKITSKGFHVKNLLKERCFYPMQVFEGTPPQVMRQMVLNNVVEPVDQKRVIPRIKIAGELPVVDANISMQQTGNDVYDELQKLAKEYNLGFDMIPKIVEYENAETNIDELDFMITRGRDCTFGNTEGNDPVIFSLSLNNLENTSYIRDYMNYRNMAYVAGEGEASARILITIGEVNASGLARKELWVDARDLQKQRDDGSTISDYTYNKMLVKRGEEKLQESRSYETYEGTVIQSINNYLYGRDFMEGDMVTLYDEDLGLRFDTIISQVQITHDRSGEHIDVTFGYDSV